MTIAKWFLYVCNVPYVFHHIISSMKWSTYSLDGMNLVSISRFYVLFCFLPLLLFDIFIKYYSMEWRWEGMGWPWKGGDWMSVLNKNKHRFWWPSKAWGEVLRKVFSQVFSYPSTVCDNDRETMIDDKRTKLSTEANKLLFMYQ